ncbi:sensor histidine kinase [Aureispira anguillae]|nr:sensor histidine kinase [Aureispira anguillae]
MPFLSIPRLPLWWGLCMLLGVSNIQGQSPYLKHFSFSEGLPSNTVYAVYQDKQGYIWFGTNLGVCRYNGYEIENFINKEGIPDLDIFGFYEDSQDRLWFRTFNGKLGYYKNGQFYNENFDCALRVKNPSSLIASIQEYKGSIYFTYFRKRILQLDSTTKQLHDIKLDKNADLVQLYNNKILTALRDCDSFKVHSLGALKTLKKIPCPSFLELSRSASYKEGWLFSNYKTLRYLDLKKGTNTLLTSFKRDIIAIHTIDSLVWVGTFDGAYLLRIKNDSSITILSSVLRGKKVTAICKDFEGGLWFSTLNNGVYYDYNTNLNIHYSTKNKTEALGTISSLSVDQDQRTWLGFSKNKYGYGYPPNITFKEFSRYKHHEVRRIAFLGNKVWGLGGSILGLIKNKNKNLSKIPQLIFAAKAILLDEEGNYLIGGNPGLLKIPQELPPSHTEKYSTLLNRIPLKFRLIKDRVNYLHKDLQKQVWLGLYKGLFKLEGNQILEIKFKGKSLEDIRGICNYDWQTFLVTTSQQGVFVVKNNQVVQNIGVADGLNAMNCFKCIVDQKKRAWINTSKGINLLSGINDSIKIQDISFELGLQNEKIVDIALSNDTLLFATPDEVLSYFPQSAPLSSPPILIIDEVRVNNIPQVNINNLELKPHQNNLRIAFTALSYKNNKAIKYLYKLIGVAHKWTTTTHRAISFDALPAGRYTFQLKAINLRGIESQLLEVNFTIAQPFHRSIYFFLLILLGLGFLFYLLLKIRITKLKQKHEVEQRTILNQKKKAELEGELRVLEQQALRLQMNPHFIFNALNTIKGYYSSKDIQKANTYISKFSHLLRIILEHKKRTISLAKERELLNLYLKLVMLQYNTNFEFSFTIDPSINPYEVVIPSMLLQPFVENAIIHGISTMLKNGKITINIQRKDSQLYCSIRDNGIGRKAAKQHRFSKTNRVNAIDITKRRLELIQEESEGEASIFINDLYNEQHQALGTEIMLILPYKEEW